MPPSPVNDDRFPTLDLIRFAAALLVVFGHTRGLLLVGIDSVPNPTALVRGFYLISGLQHEGVVLFFVVSGFLVGGSAWQRMAEDRFSVRSYLLNRFTRIYLVLIPALALVGIVAAAGAVLFPGTRFYAERPLFPSGVSDGWGWDQIPCHLFAVQGLLCEAWGANPPLWSLGFEWTFYLIGPVLFAAVLARMRALARFALVVTVAAIVIVLQEINTTFIQWLAIWMLGVVAASVSRRGYIPTLVGIGGMLLCLGTMVVSRTKSLPPDATDALLSVGLAITLGSRTIARWNFRSRAIDRGARFSYSLYLLHLPLCVFFGALLENLFDRPVALVQPDWLSVPSFAAMVCCTLLASWLFAKATEDHTAAVRRQADKLIRRVSVAIRYSR